MLAQAPYVAGAAYRFRVVVNDRRRFNVAFSVVFKTIDKDVDLSRFESGDFD